MIQKDLAQQVISPAAIGKKLQLNRELALLHQAQPITWGKWPPWAVLILGVGLLAFMARILKKEIEAADEKKVAGK